MNDISKILLITDLDGTLLTKDKTISETDLEAINTFRKKGGLFSVATGRTIQAVKPYFDVLKPDMPVILYNGAMIYDTKNKKILRSEFLKSNAGDIIKDILERFPFAACEILKADGIYVVKNNEYEQKHIQVCNVTPVYCDIDDMECSGWLKVLFAMNPEKSDEVWNYVSGYKNSGDFVRSSAMFIEMLPENVSKGYALKKYRELAGLDSSYRIAAVGDYNNDIEMLEYADYGIAPANACDEVKKSACFVSDKSCSENAVADAVKYIFTEAFNS